MRKLLNIAICDDEPSMVSELEARVKGFFVETDVAKFYNGTSLLKSCQTEDYDIIFLDISMNALDGMETARRLRDQAFNGCLIFVTALEDYVFDAFEVAAYDYLVKPIDYDKFIKTMTRLQKRLTSSCLTIQKDGESRLLPLGEIVYCEVLNRKIYIHTADGETIDYYDTIENLERKLEQSDSGFFRCHRSFLINLDHLKGFGKDIARMFGGADIPVSRLRRKELEVEIIKHLKDR